MCGARWLSLSLLILFFSLAAPGSYAQVVISETNYQQLVKNLSGAKTELEIWGSSLNLREKRLNERELALQMKESFLKQKEQGLITREENLQGKEGLIQGLQGSLTIACESLNRADLQAAKIEAENKVLKIGGVAGWAAAALFGTLYLLSRF